MIMKQFPFFLEIFTSTESFNSIFNKSLDIFFPYWQNKHNLEFEMCTVLLLSFGLVFIKLIPKLWSQSAL